MRDTPRYGSRRGLPSRTPGVRWLPAPPPLVVTAPATAQNATALRRTFHRWAKALIDNDTINDLTLAVYEALTNAAEHAFTTHKEPGTIWLYATIANDEVLITITDNGTWKPPGHRSTTTTWAATSCAVRKVASSGAVSVSTSPTTVTTRASGPCSFACSPMMSEKVLATARKI
ncbi:MAG: ATP-binding protein [Pseudonocardiaceae bacterium]